MADSSTSFHSQQRETAGSHNNLEPDLPGDESQPCIICRKPTGTDLKEFDAKTWEVAKKAAESRLQLKNDKYRDATTEIILQQGRGRSVYHPKPCYKNFTAVKKRSAAPTTEEPPSKKPGTRGRRSLSPSDSKGLLKGSCIFCPKVRKTIKQKEEKLSDCLTLEGCEKIIAAAQHSSNERLKSIVCGGIDLVAKEAQYHKSCRSEFFKEIGGPSLKDSQVTSRKIHAQTFSTLAEFLELEVMAHKKAMFVSSVFELYKAEYITNGGAEDDFDSYTTQALTRKIKEEFKHRISFSLFDTRKGNFLYSSEMSEVQGKAHLQSEKERQQTTVRSAALHLRKEILQMPKWSTPTPTTIETLKACSPDLPDDLMLFFRTLLCGLRKSPGDVEERKTKAMASDAVFNTSRGSVHPWKQTVLGLGIGTLTGSSLILRILNRLGYSLSYDEVKSLETEFAFSSEENESDAPDGIELEPDRGTGVGFDNYDVNMETEDGKDTLHATVGICYQNTMENEVTTTEIGIRSERNRRQFDGREREITPTYLQLKKAKFEMSSSGDQHEEMATMATVTQRMIDFYWLMLLQVMPQPLFVGFFSQFVCDDLPKQNICYMDPIPASPTRNDVVRETMMRSMNVAIETKQDYAVVTYDLAIALKAYSIQSLEAPLFDRLLIMLGNFHLELAFFGAVGTYINESGGDYLLIESDILAEGSLNGFIRGKYYNRCSRIHEILAAAMERKIYQSFMVSLPQEKQDDMNDWLQNAPKTCSEIESFLEASQMFKEHLVEYEEFFAKVMEGTMGPTAQYWCTYVYMINRVHRDLMRAVRTNDIDSYITILPAVIDMFFGLNRPNYARWGVLYLEKLKTADPNIRDVLEKGAFSIRRTSKDFCRAAVDLTLEQTVNRDAASPMRGIVGMHSSPNAIRRWCLTSTQRGMAVTEVRRLTGLLPEEQPRAQLGSNRIKKDNQQIEAMLQAITQSCDPFSSPATDSACLLNIATGKATSKATQEYLTHSLTVGHDQHMKFREECGQDQSRLLKPIKRRKVQNFASDNTKPKTSSATKQRMVSNSLRDSFIRMMVVISQNTQFSLKHVMSYPITDVPLSIAQPDGSLMKTNKSKLLNKLESLQEEVTSLPHIDVTLIDGGLLLHSFLSAIGTISSYGHLARRLLAHVCSSSSREIHVLFDKYISTSLKESERRLRGAEDQPFVISGSEQSPKQSCQKLLKNGIFKDQLAQFLLREWRKEEYSVIVGNKTLVLSYGGYCVHINVNQISGEMNAHNPQLLQGNHEEADTLIAFHAAHVPGTILVRASDTDVMVILVGMIGRDIMQGRPLKSILMDCGSGNNRRYINVTSIAQALENKQKGLPAAIPGLHAFTGCDFTASFYMKGKTKPLELLEKDNDGSFIRFFHDLSSSHTPSRDKAEEYVCTLYGIKAAKKVDEARHIKLVQMTGKISKETQMDNIKKVDCALLPPCSKTLWNKTQRAHYISIIWGHADTAYPDEDLDPLRYGWTTTSGCYTPSWFPGSASPDNLFDSTDDEQYDIGSDDANSEPLGTHENTNLETDSDPADTNNADVDVSDDAIEYVGCSDPTDIISSESEWSDESDSENET